MLTLPTALRLGAEGDALADTAAYEVGRLEGMATLLPDPSAFVHGYVRKEAVLSAQIEGTRSTLPDLLMAEQGAPPPGLPPGDLAQATSYVAAMQHGLARMGEGFPLSLRLIREIHALVMGGGDGGNRAPGRFRRSQVWIGGTTPDDAVFVPPPANEVGAAMGALERYLHAADPGVRPLVKAALAHVWFETIHPFLDGNGRVGRVLITLTLCNEGMLTQPLLYLSVFLRRHRDEYYARLQAVRTEGDWAGWVAFFMRAVISVARGATATTRDVIRLVADDRGAITRAGRAAPTMLRLHEVATRRIVVSPLKAAEELGVSLPAVYRGLERLRDLGIVVEATGRRRGRLFSYARYLALLQGDITLPGEPDPA